jgi:hypothetical protein
MVMRALALCFTIYAGASFGPGDHEAEPAGITLHYKAHFQAGRVAAGSILPHTRQVWYYQGGSIDTAHGQPDGPDAIIIDGYRLTVEPDGRAH